MSSFVDEGKSIAFFAAVGSERPACEDWFVSCTAKGCFFHDILIKLSFPLCTKIKFLVAKIDARDHKIGKSYKVNQEYNYQF